MTRLVWDAQMHSDLGEDFRLVALDTRGRGLSDKPEDAYGDSELWADDLQAVIDTLNSRIPSSSGRPTAGSR